MLEEPELDLLDELELEPEPLLDELLLLVLLLLSVFELELLPAEEPVVLLPAFGLLLLVDELAGAVLVLLLLPALFAATAPAAPAAHLRLLQPPP